MVKLLAAKLDGRHATTGSLHFNDSGHGYELESGRDGTHRKAKGLHVEQGVIQAASPQVA